MNIRVNGKDLQLSEQETTVADLLDVYKVKKVFSVVEVNREIISKNVYETTKLSNGDAVEIVHFVGGG
ncbi:sulfur carrier protein ThiS [Halobacillus sp. H74]|uniref:sulfur carrier protein ThiS n=1 Tax=Halobacillus sp. H74 TaxID=3457436 RepID=UPI003FCEABA2